MAFKALSKNLEPYWQRFIASSNGGPASEQDQPTDSPSPVYHVTYQDVRDTRVILRSLKLPAELVLDILDRARYWPCQQFAMRERISIQASPPHNEATKLSLDANLLTPEFLATFEDEVPKIREIVWDIRSRDQGWTSEGTAGTFQSSSWLDVSILRPGPDPGSDTPIIDEGLEETSDFPTRLNQALQSRGSMLVACPDSIYDENGEAEYFWHLQSNRVASTGFEHYRIICSAEQEGFMGDGGSGNGHGFLESVKSGDRVLVWARAKYPGWRCQVDSLVMTVYYGF